MNHLVRAALVAAVLGASAAASAETVDFSYTFADGQLVTGSFDGTTTNGGASFTGISDMQVAFNGIAFAPVTVGNTTYGNATLQINNYNTGTESFDDTTPVTIYANGALNNFVISDVDAASNSNPDYEFAYTNDPVLGSQVVAANFLHSDSFSGPTATQLDIDSPANVSNWTLTVAPVPLPAGLPLLLSGLGVLGFAARRRAA